MNQHSDITSGVLADGRPAARTETGKPIVAVVDIDGVVYDFVTAFGDAVAAMDARPRSSLPPAEAWDFYETWGFTLAEFLDRQRRAVAEHELCRHGVPLPGSIAGWKALRDLDVRIHVATDLSSVEDAAAHRRAWLSEWGFVFDELEFTADKAAVAGRYLAAGWQVYAVEDRPKNFTALQVAGADVFLRDQRWNRGHRVGHLRVLDLDDFAARVARGVAVAGSCAA